MRLNSLALRLFVAAAVWTLIVLPIAGIVLNQIYRAEIERNFDRRLVNLLTLLIASSVPEDGTTPVEPNDFGDALFKLPLTGWYWQITSMAQPGLTLISDSLVGDALSVTPIEQARTAGQDYQLFNTQGPDSQKLRIIRRVVQIESADHQSGRFAYIVTGNRSEIENTVADFGAKLALSLAVLGLGLVAATLLQVRFGLQPLRAIGEGLARIRSGKAERLEGNLPAEIEPLQIELNALINSNRDIVERARTHVGNLAHALKTPLSVIINEAHSEQSTFAGKVAQQAQVMRDQINHYLDRARMAARTGVIGGVTDVQPVIVSLSRALSRIYEDRDIEISFQCPDNAQFQGERQDLEEMLGNLLDNACKWAEAKVELAVTQAAPGAEGGPSQLAITVDDDGPGLLPPERTAALKRGKRLDETKPGSGLGLSIVGDLAELYRGRFRLNESPLGGLRAELTLPSV